MDGWTKVTDKKALRQQEHQKKRIAMDAIAKARRILADEEIPEYAIPANFDDHVRQHPDKATSIAKNFIKKLRGQQKETSGHKEKKRSKSSDKSKNSGSRHRSLSTSEDVVSCVKEILKQEPGGWLHVSGVGNKLENITGHAWNKKYKEKFGKLKAFLAKHPKHFHLQPESEAGQDRVYTRQEFEATRARENKIRKKQQEQQRQRAAPTNNKKASGKRRCGCCRSCVKRIFLIVLFSLMGYLSFVSYDTFNTTKESDVYKLFPMVKERVIKDSAVAQEKMTTFKERLLDDYPQYVEQAKVWGGKAWDFTEEWGGKAWAWTVVTFHELKEQAIPACIWLKEKTGELIQNLRPALNSFRANAMLALDALMERAPVWKDAALTFAEDTRQFVWSYFK